MGSLKWTRKERWTCLFKGGRFNENVEPESLKLSYGKLVRLRYTCITYSVRVTNWSHKQMSCMFVPFPRQHNLFLDSE